MTPTKENRMIWKKRLAMLLTFVLVASGLPVTMAPQTAKAATANPGGVDGTVLWLRPDEGIAAASGQAVSAWIDQSDSQNTATQSTYANQPTYWNNADYNVNFNPILRFDGNDLLNLDVNKLPTGKTPRTIVSVAATEVNDGNHYIISWGQNNQYKLMGMMQIGTAGALTGYTNEFMSSSGFWQPKIPNELFGTYDGANGALYSKMKQIAKQSRLWDTGNVGAAVGSILGGGQYWTGTIGDLIVFNRVLSDSERQRISTYLAIKYGYTMDSSDYLASDGSKVWNASENTGYRFNIAGISRDDNGALLQKQSHSTNAGKQVTIGLNEIAEMNSVNNSVFDAAMQYLVWGDNGKALTFNKQLGATNQYYAERLWKVQNAGAVGKVQIAIPKGAMPPNALLLVSDSDSDFSSAAQLPLTEITLNGVPHYAAKMTLHDGQYFTYAAKAPLLESAALEQTVANGNQVTLTFDQDVQVTDLTGFTIKVGNDVVTIGPGDFKIDPANAKKLILTLPAGSDVSGKSVNVSYDGLGNLKSPYGTPVHSFAMDAVDSFVAALNITQPSVNPVTAGKPTIEGTVEPGSAVKIVIKDSNGIPITGAGGAAVVDGNGNWTFTPNAGLTDGKYTIEVIATKDNRIATKTKETNVAIAAPALTIAEPSGNTVSVSKPEFKGITDAGATVTVAIKDKDGKVVSTPTITVNTYGAWSFTPDKDLADGKYTFEVASTKDGKSTQVTKTVTVDTSLPALTITEPSGSTVSVPKPEFKGTADAGATVTVAIKDKDGNVISTQTVPVNPDGTWNFTPDKALVDGNYKIEVTATKDGKSTQVTKTVIVDTSLPALTITEPSGSTVSVAKPEFKGTADAGATVTVAIKDKNGNVVGTPTVTVNAYGAWNFTPDKALADGNYTIEVTSTKDGKSTQATKTVIVATTNDSKLAGLQLNSWNGTPIGLSPAFDGSSTKYTASVTNSVYSVTVSSLPLDPNAKIEVSVNNGPWQQVPNGATSSNLPLNVGMNTIVVKVTDAKGHVTEYTLTITRESSDNGDPDSSSGGSTTTPSTSTGSSSSGGSTTPNGSGIETSVNGKDDTFATGKESTSGDRKVTSVQVDLDKLNKALSQGNGQKLAIRSSKDGDMKVDGLTAGTVKQLADKGTSLEISNPLAIYPVPGGKMDLSAVSKQLGNAALGDIAVHIDIARSSDTLITNAKNKAAAEGYELLVTPVDLDMTFSHDGKMVRAGQLNGYAAKYIALPEGIDPNRITTGVIVNPDGSVFHVPTVVTKINSRYYALIKDLRSNGSYSVIWNPQDFDDVKSHWGKADVNNIAARLDLAGTGNNTFSPDRNVTRSEFSEIVVAGLGLKRQNAPQNKFPDVSDSAWYRSPVAIANEFDIVRGYEDGNFYGDRQITREQGMAMIARAYKLIETKTALSQEQTDALLAKYEDAKKVSAWAREDIALMIEAGIVQGNGAQLLSPQSNMTRAEVTALIARLLKTTNLIDK
ncbi:Ig-like domain-containing protein [Paenibacillus tyrfis]|uniref:Ig-like domain-containing protein n=1 Tax=Paenibacillus tyrfis TaxID=1501230 RepID=UPI0015C5B560|nr:Ig-like domain-containing protein [Paenibacillus tyrfis]